MSGSKTMTKEAAARRLGVSLRHVFSLTRRGLLRTTDLDDTAVRRMDVERLCRLRENPAEHADDRNLMRLSARMTRLEKRLDVASRMLGLYQEPLELNAHELRSFMEMAAFNAHKGWAPHAEEMWADVFERLRLEDLEALEGLTGDEHPWRAFYRLCLTMHHAPFDEAIRERLVDGQQNLRDVATVWCHRKGITPRTATGIMKRTERLDGRTLRKFSRRLEKRELEPTA